jgi:hypothetical protein
VWAPASLCALLLSRGRTPRKHRRQREHHGNESRHSPRPNLTSG